MTFEKNRPLSPRANVLRDQALPNSVRGLGPAAEPPQRLAVPVRLVVLAVVVAISLVWLLIGRAA